MIHKSVLTEELIDNLNLKSGMIVVDGTLGAGGHSSEVLKKILPGGTLVSIDWDKRAVENFENFLLKKGIAVSAKKNPPPAATSNISDKYPSGYSRVSLYQEGKIIGHWWGINDNYSNLENIIRGLPNAISGVDALFLDLGFSSDQIEDPSRGFSFMKDGPLDMRYSESSETTAVQVVNRYPEKDLREILKIYGEEKYAARIARQIVAARKIQPLKTTQDLVVAISRALPIGAKKGKIHFATRTFQALRIEVNSEIENLKNFLPQALEALASEGRLAIISFHSLEDRIVKNYFRVESRDCVCPAEFPKCVCDHRKTLRIITKKPIVASSGEVLSNPRARSAKLRIAQKI